MECPKCKAEIPEGKIYCEKCGAAIQMVPDYNPVDDITIGTAEKQPEDTNRDYGKTDSENSSVQSVFRSWRYMIAGIVLILLGILIFQTAYRAAVHSQETEAGLTELPVLLEKPSFSIAPGVYEYSPEVTISHGERNDGIIYYTTDGTTPTQQSQVYNKPIQMEEGTTVIRAVFIRFDGMQSEEADGTYEVVFDYPGEPVFSVEGGNYSQSFQVTLTAEPDCRIYYTTNGEEPGPGASLYRGAITIPAGLTVLQAVAIDGEGGMSGIVEAIYNVDEIVVPQETDMDQVSGVIP